MGFLQFSQFGCNLFVCYFCYFAGCFNTFVFTQLYFWFLRQCGIKDEILAFFFFNDLDVRISYRNDILFFQGIVICFRNDRFFDFFFDNILAKETFQYHARSFTFTEARDIYFVSEVLNSRSCAFFGFCCRYFDVQCHFVLINFIYCYVHY